MSCLSDLYKTYEVNQKFIGQPELSPNGKYFILLPISHTTQTAHIQVNIKPDGRFHTAHVIENKDDRETVIPCTEDAASRAGSKVAPYPLHDKLIYVAGDFASFGGKIKQQRPAPFEAYISSLKKWAESSYAIGPIRSIYSYLGKGQLIQDLVEEKVLWLDENGKLIGKWNDKYKPICNGMKPEIFSAVSGGEQMNAFVRFNVVTDSEDTRPMPEVWRNPKILDSFVHYYSEQLQEDDLCFVEGKWLPATDKHANKIRNSGDKAKLISANDSSGFTFRGRFSDSKEAASISYDASQKAHNALKWLIRRQGKILDNRVFLVWSIDGEDTDIPNPQDNWAEHFGMTIEDDWDEPKSADAVNQTDEIAYTNEQVAQQFRLSMSGYRNHLGDDDSTTVHILILDSATTGRLAILYYRNINKEEYFQRLIDWHKQCAWEQMYLRSGDRKRVIYIGAPVTKDIAYAAYGSRANEKVVKNVMERLLPCIVDRKRIPKDIVNQTFHRAANPIGSSEHWEWEKTLRIACALINKQICERSKEGSGFSVALDEERIDRSYLFGRMLAIADVLEHRALQSEDWRQSNAMRYMNDFSEHPKRTWQIIQKSLIPYQAKLRKGGVYLTQLIDQVASAFSVEDFNDKPLDGLFLLGFYSQRYQLYQKKSTEELQQKA